jgi:hypothetical protein
MKRAKPRRRACAPEYERRRVDMQAVIESVVTAMVNAKLNSADDPPPEDSASDRTPS